ncbi:hypothetical protein CPC08DRAFT_750332 [Agrocybe pediades]|nr:hypothetical protein CPC08DRAFT_750332 [Agrocybe pediades]
MAYRSHTASPAGSQSPASSSSSPYINDTPLDTLVPPHDDQDSSFGTPNHSTTSLPRNGNAGKGGCWTCRVRRKKCDEQREGDSCKTCKRLTIKCLGWGAKRPEWMRDKKNVDAYKANIKAQLTRAGLIRGQPRHNPLAVPSQRGNAHHVRRPANHHPSNNANRLSFESFQHSSELSFPHMSHNSNMNPSHLLNAGLHTSASSSYEDLLRLDPYDPSTSYLQPSLVNPPLIQDSLLDFGLLLQPSGNDMLFPDPTLLPPPPSQSQEEFAAQEGLVVYYFDNVHRMQSCFGGKELNDITYAAIVDEPRGAVTLAVCALAELHCRQTRVSQGLEPFQGPEKANTSYLRDEAILVMQNNKSARGCWVDSDAIAAYHLVNYSQMSGGAYDWETPFQILVNWLMQTNLHLAENPWVAFINMSSTQQYFVKATLWLDIFSSISVLRAPKFLTLFQSLFEAQNSERDSFWPNDQKLHMENMTGCPDDALWAIAETSALAHWKASQIRNGCLSYPELVRRGTIIGQRLHRSQSQLPTTADGGHSGSADVVHPTPEERMLVSTIFRETANLYLQAVLSNSTPGVPEITTSVQHTARLFSQLFPSELDRALVFPICLAGCMTNDSSIRDFFKVRLRGLNETFGNLMQTRRLMEAVWQKRDINGKDVDVNETIREQNLRLLLI